MRWCLWLMIWRFTLLILANIQWGLFSRCLVHISYWRGRCKRKNRLEWTVWGIRYPWYRQRPDCDWRVCFHWRTELYVWNDRGTSRLYRRCLDEFISHYGTLEEVVEHKDDIYYYPDCETMTDVAYYYIDELQALGDIPASLQNYIDYEAYGRDLDMGGCFIETSRGMCEIPY